MLKAGSNHGGDLHIHNSIVEAGIGGKVIVSGGDGGEHGKGGDVHISSTTFKGGGNN